MTDTPKPETGPAEPPASKPSRSEHIHTFLLARWKEARVDCKHILVFAKDLAIIHVIFVPLVGWTGLMAVVGYAEKGGFNLGFQDISTLWVYLLGGMTLFTKFSKIYGYIIIFPILYFIVKSITKSIDLGFFGKYIKLFVTLLVAPFLVVLPTMAGLHFGEKMAKELQETPSGVIKLHIPDDRKSQYPEELLKSNDNGNSLLLLGKPPALPGWQ